jgi:predicted KAP-like P-loop ATPase
MWSDNETERDFLNFTGVADTVAEIILQAQGRPVSIGVSGAWGVGKSSMIKLIRKALEDHIKPDKDTNKKHSEFVFVEFNAWLYQGYDDARASLMEVIASTLEEEANKRKKAVEKVKDLSKKVNWLRAAKLTAGSALALGFGLPPVGLIGDLLSVVEDMRKNGVTPEDVTNLEEGVTKLASAAAGVIKSKSDSSPPKEIQAIRDSFEKILKEMDVKLVVLIDDLDRCLPGTTISTLEAIRLFLFLQNTAFVIAADDALIKNSVRQHFVGVGEDHVLNYFDKLIQVPIRVPPLGTQEVRAYLMLLYIENSTLDDEVKENMRTKVCEQLGKTWRGERVDRAFMESIAKDLPQDLITRFNRAERLAPLMTSATNIAGNPRLIKRFLNALSIRLAISRAHSVDVDEAALAKMLLFERCGNPQAYAELAKVVNENTDGKPSILSEWEQQTDSSQELTLSKAWDEPFVHEWLALPPKLAEMDLRGILYVSREHAPIITAEDRMSSEGMDILKALLEHPGLAKELHDRLLDLSVQEITIIMDRLLDEARQIQKWGTPPILDACLAVISADPTQGRRLSAFLSDRLVTASIVPRIGNQPWANDVFKKWASSSSLDKTVRKAIDVNQEKDNGNVTI